MCSHATKTFYKAPSSTDNRHGPHVMYFATPTFLGLRSRDGEKIMTRVQLDPHKEQKARSERRLAQQDVSQTPGAQWRTT